MKKVLAVILSCIMVLSAFSFIAGARPLNSGKEALDSDFTDWECVNMEDGEVLTDGVYYSPVKSSSDTDKYPLVIWLHGMTSGKQPRLQLNYNLSNFASDEYQARFGNGGFYVFAPRAVNGGDWNPSYYKTLKYIIDTFIQENVRNIDKSRIYIGGYSTGGSMVWDMLQSYPTFFAAALIAAPVTEPTDLSDVTLSRMCNIPIWVFCCDKDYHHFAKTENVKSVYDSLVSLSKNPGNLRLTTFTEARYADGTKSGTVDQEHFIWDCITFDMHMNDGVTPYVYGTTVDGNGNTITFEDPENGVIRWLSQQELDDGRDTSMAGKTVWQKIADFFVNFFNKIKSFFQGIFG